MKKYIKSYGKRHQANVNMQKIRGHFDVKVEFKVKRTKQNKERKQVVMKGKFIKLIQ